MKEPGKVVGIFLLSLFCIIGVLTSVSFVLGHVMRKEQPSLDITTHIFSGDTTLVEQSSYPISAVPVKRSFYANRLQFHVWSMQYCEAEEPVYSIACYYVPDRKVQGDSFPAVEEIVLCGLHADTLRLRPRRTITTRNATDKVTACALHCTVNDSIIHKAMPDTIGDVELSFADGTKTAFPCNPKVAGFIIQVYDSLKASSEPPCTASCISRASLREPAYLD